MSRFRRRFSGAQREFLDAGASLDLNPLHVVIDVSGLDVNGYDAADWLREQQRIDMGLSDHRHVEATLSVADDDRSAARLIGALRAPPSTPPAYPGHGGRTAQCSRTRARAGHVAPRRLIRRQGNRRRR